MYNESCLHNGPELELGWIHTKLDGACSEILPVRQDYKKTVSTNGAWQVLSGSGIQSTRKHATSQTGGRFVKVEFKNKCHCKPK